MGVFSIITVSRAGSKRVVEYHGNALRFVCDTCRGHHPRESLDFSHTPLYCLCGGLIRPEQGGLGRSTSMDHSHVVQG